MSKKINPQKERLKNKGIVIEEVYKQGDRICIRTSDGKKKDPISHALRVEKNYYKNGELLLKKECYDNYFYSSFDKSNNATFTCSECGYTGKDSDFVNGCPYCGSFFEREQAIVKWKTYFNPFQFFICLSLLIILWIILCYSSILNFFNDPINNYYDLLLNLFFLIILISFGSLTFLVVTVKINGRKKEINENKLFKDLYTNLFKYYYSEELSPKDVDLIDFEIEENDKYKIIKDTKTGEITRVIIRAKIDKIYYRNNKIIEEVQTPDITMELNPNYVEKYQEGSVRKCKNCGYNVSVLDRNCPYCNTPMPSNTKWIIKEIK